jgi:hypothetical protein
MGVAKPARPCATPFAHPQHPSHHHPRIGAFQALPHPQAVKNRLSLTNHRHPPNEPTHPFTPKEPHFPSSPYDGCGEARPSLCDTIRSPPTTVPSPPRIGAFQALPHPQAVKNRLSLTNHRPPNEPTPVPSPPRNPTSQAPRKMGVAKPARPCATPFAHPQHPSHHHPRIGAFQALPHPQAVKNRLSLTNHRHPPNEPTRPFTPKDRRFPSAALPPSG